MTEGAGCLSPDTDMSEKTITSVGTQPFRLRLASWIGAFRGFYRKDAGRYGQDFITRMLYSARGLILVISFQAGIISGLFAIIYGSFDLLNFVLVVLAFVLLHVVSNLLNDLFGFKYGDDTPDSPRRRYTLHPIADNVVSVSEMKMTIFSLLVILAFIAAYFALLRGPGIILLAAIGAGILFMYDVSSLSLKKIGLGELSSFIVWGPLMVAGGFYAISGFFSLTVVVASIPYGLGVMSVLVGKHIDQIDFDRGRNIRTLPVLAGESRSRAFLVLTIVLMYVVTAVAAATLFIPFTLLLVAANYKRLLQALRVVRGVRPEAPPEGFVGWPLWYHRQALLHNKRFGWLYILGLLIFSLTVAAGIHLPLF